MGRVDELQAELRALATRGDLARLRIPIIQDFLSGILGGSPDVQQPAAVPHRAEVARPVIDASAPEWPPRVGTYDPAGRAVRVGELAKLGLAFTFEEVRAFILGLAQPAPLSSNGLVQVGRAASALVGELAALALSPADYRAAWRRLFGQPLPVSIGPQLSNIAPPAIASTSDAGGSTEASRSNHTHAHGDQAGGALHALATGGAGPAGFMAPAQVDKLASIAAGATNTPLSNTAPPSIAAASAAGTLTEASRADHTHAHGSQAGGALHTLATGGAGPAGFMAPAQVDKLASIQTGATRGGQGILLHADRTASLIASSIVGCDGQVVLFSSDVVPEVATISGTAQDFTLEANTNTPGPVTISIFRAPSGSVTYVLTGVLLSLATGTRAATSALSFAVNRGDRIVALSNAVWAHGGLTIRGRILP